MCPSVRHAIYPVRGRKQIIVFVYVNHKKTRSPRYLPRKGTETVRLTSVFASPKVSVRHAIYPVRGRKRSIAPLHHRFPKFSVRHAIYPVRGRKLPEAIIVPSGLKSSPRYLPRKGTETKSNIFLKLKKILVRHAIYPVRGRKLLETYKIIATKSCMFATLFTP